MHRPAQRQRAADRDEDERHPGQHVGRRTARARSRRRRARSTAARRAPTHARGSARPRPGRPPRQRDARRLRRHEDEVVGGEPHARRCWHGRLTPRCTRGWRDAHLGQGGLCGARRDGARAGGRSREGRAHRPAPRDPAEVPREDPLRPAPRRARRDAPRPRGRLLAGARPGGDHGRRRPARGRRPARRRARPRARGRRVRGGLRRAPEGLGRRPHEPAQRPRVRDDRRPRRRDAATGDRGAHRRARLLGPRAQKQAALAAWRTHTMSPTRAPSQATSKACRHANARPP